MLDVYYSQDLKNAKTIIDWIAWAEPQYNFNPMIDEWCKEAPKELDFNHEAGIFISKLISCSLYSLKVFLVYLVGGWSYFLGSLCP